MNYTVSVDRLNDDETINDYEDMIKRSNVALVVPEVLDINAEYMIVDSLEYNYAMEKVEIDEFYDDVEVRIKGNNNDSGVIALNLTKDIKSSNYIDAKYDSLNGVYVFTINEPGVYIVVEDSDNIAVTKLIGSTVSALDSINAKNNPFNIFIQNIVQTLGIILVLAVIIGIAVVIFIMP